MGEKLVKREERNQEKNVHKKEKKKMHKKDKRKRTYIKEGTQKRRKRRKIR